MTNIVETTFTSLDKTFRGRESLSRELSYDKLVTKAKKAIDLIDGYEKEHNRIENKTHLCMKAIGTFFNTNEGLAKDHLAKWLATSFQSENLDEWKNLDSQVIIIHNDENNSNRHVLNNGEMLQEIDRTWSVTCANEEREADCA